LFALLFTVLGSLRPRSPETRWPAGAFGVLFGVGSIVLFPIIYRLLRFVGGLISVPL
jgi:hypothetical protein